MVVMVVNGPEFCVSGHAVRVDVAGVRRYRVAPVAVSIALPDNRRTA
jgi:hypothetical protein